MRQVERVDSIDHLRGILAVTIMIYHYCAWTFPNWMSPSGLLSVLGYYGVSAFFVISGMSLSIAYRDKLTCRTQVFRFYIKRLFRIAPLYWLALSATICAALLAQYSKGVQPPFGWKDAIANYTLTFSFGHTRSLVTGGWSIGNEVFFYLLFPLLFWLICKSTHWAASILAASASLLAIWAYYVVPAGKDDLEAWGYYINNWNQLFFFTSGVVIGRYMRPVTVHRRAHYAALLGALALLSLANVETRPELIEGWHRIYLSGATLLLVLSVYQINWQSSSSWGKVLTFLGLISYSLYLLHPLVRSAMVIVGSRVGFEPMTVLVISIALTVLVSWISYRLIETPGIRWGNRIARLDTDDRPNATA